MFRSRKYSSSKTETVHTTTSSLSSGNASIIKRPEAPSVVVVEEQQPRYYSSEPSTPEYEDYNEHEIIDLQASTPATPGNELTIESMSAVIAAAVQMSAAGGSPSSLSLGSASILQPFSKTENASAKNKIEVKRRFSSRLFTNPWSKKLSSSPSPTSPTSTPATPALEPSSSPFDSTSNITMMTDDDNSSQGSPRTSSVSASSPTTKTDDGRDELMYRGIQIKEIKTTLKTLVISDQVRCPMPEVRLERPGFARINY